ncbi:MAG TPA: MdtA/MuxA family multidrug efflux RND transporter periplasmic adaptor subunit [Acidisarcina sp.]
MSSAQATPPVRPISNPPLGTAPPLPDQPRPRGHLIRNLLLLLALLLVGLIIWRISTASSKSGAAANASQAAAANRPVPVQVAAVQQRSMPIYLTGLGTVTPYNTVTIKARVTGELTRVNFKEGQEVRKGAELMTIDPRPYQAIVDQARGQLARDQAQLTDNQAEYGRYKALYSEGVTSKEQLDTMQANLGQFEGAIKADQANIAAAQLNVTYCHITSPIDGRVGLRLVDVGNVITANTTNLVVVNQFQPIAVDFTLPEDQLPKVLTKLNTDHQMPVEAYDRSDTQHIASGMLLTVDNQIDPTTGTDKLKGVFPNKDEVLFPDQFVNVRLVLEQRNNAITVPAAAMQHGTQGDFVWLVKPDHTVQMQNVKVELTQGNTVIIAAGLAGGESVVTDGADKLRPGGRVDPRQSNSNRPGGQGQSNGLMGQ